MRSPRFAWGVSVSAAGEKLFPNAERYLKSPAEMAERFAAAPGAIARTREIAERSTFSLAELRYEYPEELAPEGETPLDVSDAADLGRRGQALSAGACRRKSARWWSTSCG